MNKCLVILLTLFLSACAFEGGGGSGSTPMPETPGSGPPAGGTPMPETPDPDQTAGNNPPDDTGNNPPDDTGNNPPDDMGNNPPDDMGNNPPDDMGNNPPDDMGNNPPDNTPPTPMVVIGGTVIDLDTAFTGNANEKEVQYNNREEASRKVEPGNDNVVLLDGDGEAYDTFKFWTIDGTVVTTKRPNLTLNQAQNFAPPALTGYTNSYYRINWNVPELNDLGIRHPPDVGDDPKTAGSELVASYTDKADDADTDYLEFGWWRLIDFEPDGSTDASTKKFTVRFGAYYRATSSTTTDLSGLTGTATYSGGAVGKYKVTDSSGSVTSFGTIKDGTVSLTADFSADTISGTITTLRTTSPISDVLDDTWEITLGSTSFNDQGIITQGGTTTQDATAPGGYWKGEFQRGEDATGNAIQPPAVTGKFTAHFEDGSVSGAFGAQKQ